MTIIDPNSSMKSQTCVLLLLTIVWHSKKGVFQKFLAKDYRFPVPWRLWIMVAKWHFWRMSFKINCIILVPLLPPLVGKCAFFVPLTFKCFLTPLPKSLTMSQCSVLIDRNYPQSCKETRPWAKSLGSTLKKYIAKRRKTDKQQMFHKRRPFM